MRFCDNFLDETGIQNSSLYEKTVTFDNININKQPKNKKTAKTAKIELFAKKMDVLEMEYLDTH